MSRPPPRLPEPAYGAQSPPSVDSRDSYGVNDNVNRLYYDEDDLEHPPSSQQHSTAPHDRRQQYDPRQQPYPNPEQQPYDPYAPRGKDADTDSEFDYPAPGRGAYTPSAESLPSPRFGQSDSSTPTFHEQQLLMGGEPYPTWTTDKQIPISKEEVEDICLDLQMKFGFQRESMRNIFDFLMQMLDSRASRMTPSQALLTLHADYIGGPHANYRKWYFAAQLDLDDAVGSSNNPGLQRLKSVKRNGRSGAPTRGSGAKSLEVALNNWRQAMLNMSAYDRVRQLALYLLVWGEASNIRFMPECICFLFKCADDYYRSPECQNRIEPVPEGLYLHSVIKPLYRFLRDQGYELVEGKYVRRERDHEAIIGYDDVNQLFWYPEGIARIILADKSRLVDVPPAQRFMKLDKVDWNAVFFKTYYERRTFLQLLVHFNRIWVTHISLYWFYTSYNSQKVYKQSDGSPPTAAMKWSVAALGGAVATIIMILVTLAEFTLIPTTWNNSSHLTRRLFFLLVTLCLTAGPSIYILFYDDGKKNNLPLILGIVQFFLGVVATVLFGTVPSGRMFGDRVASKSRKYLASQTFTASYPALSREARATSIALWLLIFGCKFTESYFFLTKNFQYPIQVMVGMKVQSCTTKYIGDGLCRNQVAFTLAIMYVMDLVLFFLDTFLWYVIWSTVFSIGRSFALGLSIWTPWNKIYSRLPKRVYSKLLATEDMSGRYKPKVLVSQVWNAIIISMYREHLLSIDHVQKLLYHQVQSENDRRTLRAPPFFLAQGDPKQAGEFFPPGRSEAERRISFFAQSLTTAMPQALPVDAMPTFTVLTPHYSEKVILSLREIIREQDQFTRVTLLEYLKQLHPIEWDNFVKDTKILSEEAAMYQNGAATPYREDEKSTKVDDLPYYLVGFKSSAPEYTLRTRIWASLRAQTLYRTVSGMMNYSKAIKLLYRVENPEVVQLFGANAEKLERELERMARRKFKFIVSMQRYAKFNAEEYENVEFLLRAYPDLQIAYLDEEPPLHAGGEPRLFSALIDGHSEFLADTGRRRPKFRIELPGNPILGDGKSDNQNHALVFYRGEYLQLIDANQDNYLEECIKIRNVLGEFEEFGNSTKNPYAQWTAKEMARSPVAIVGAREYIFSENTGILGDLAAGKEQTFGTLTARGLAWIGGKLHYGHPDFLNGIYMTTRGGVSKAQKGLHLNEDIFAGMNAFGRGGRIKHSEYYQCGKGRDLGFGTILNFQTKIGTGMGEQMLSREYYYLGSQLPIDRFLTFYYAHPGFHINNILVILSVQVFMVCLVYLGALNKALLVCKFDTDNASGRGQAGCYNLVPVFDWIRRCIISIFLVFAIAFLPLFLQELVERGTGRAIIRLAKQFSSASPIFEVFSTQIYTHSILSNLTFGGARYIATGRGFAMTRIPFSLLYSRFAGPSIYLGMRTLLLLLYATLAIWMPHLIYFWITVMALCVAPFMFNPHQFIYADYIIDYREYLRWMSRGNSRSHANSWIGYCRLSRTNITGFKKKKLGHPSEKLSGDVARASVRNVLVSEILFPICYAAIFVIAYIFVKSFPEHGTGIRASPLIRLAIVSLGPIVWNAAVLLVLFIASLFLGPMLGSSPKFGAVMASLAHISATVGLIAFFELLWYLELWDVSHAVLGLIATIAVQRAVHKFLIAVCLSREYKHDETNRAWWTGRWYGRSFGNSAITQMMREYIVKLIEMSLWSGDFLLGHFLLLVMTPVVIIPGIDKVHATLLFWLRPSKQIRAPLYSIKQRKRRRSIVIRYTLIYALIQAVLVALIAIPAIFRSTLHMNCSLCNNI